MADAATNALYVYHFDGTGHTVALTNASQQTVNAYAYDPYGKIMAETETIAQPFKYAGQVGIIDEGNNLYYMRARYYDANIGRFISEDPAGFAGGLNLYAYVGGNPIMAVDPSGEIGIVGGLIGAGLELGVQLAGNGGDFNNVDWVDVVGMGVVGAVAPSGLAAGKSILNSYNAAKVIKSQLSNVSAISRQVKLEGRLNSHYQIIKENIQIQGGLAAGKYLFKKYVNDYESSNGNGGK